MSESARPTPNKKLRQERDRRCWSQQELADKVGTTPLNISRWERGINTPNPYFRQKLCEIFEKTAQELGLVPSQVAENKPSEPATSRSEAVTPASLSPEVAALWNIPYRRNLFFTGREDTLQQLRELLTSHEQPVALTQSLALSGLGGIGKTQTAVEYAYRYRDSYDAVFWVRADSYALLVSDFLLVAALLNLPLHNEQDQNLIVQAVLRWLNTYERWLLILDNADNLEVVNEFIPSAGKGHVLLTTRAQSTGTVAYSINIEKMRLEEGAVFLLRRVKRLTSNTPLAAIPETVRQQAQAIVEAVDSLPLALDQAGAYIEETGCSLDDYLKFYKTHRQRLLRTRGHAASGHPEPVATTWSLSFERVEQANPAAAELLRLCAFLHPDEIPEAMIAEGASELGPLLQPVVEDELEFNEAIGNLRKYSLVKRDPELKLLNMHRLVQAVLKDAMDKETQRDWAERAVRMLNRAFPEVGYTQWPICQRYLPHAQICADLIAQWKMMFLEAAQLLSRMGNYLQERAQYQEAEPLYQYALLIREKVLGTEHPNVGESLDKLGWLHYEQGKYSQAEPMLMQALTITEKALGREHPQVATVLDHLGELYRSQSRYTQAEHFFQNALTIREQILGLEHLDTANNVNNLALLYHYQGKYAQAEPLYLRALALYEMLLGTEHPEVATALNNLAALYDEQGKHTQAESLYRRAIAIREQALGPTHPYLAYCLNNLGALYHDQGRYTEAEPFLLQALKIREQSLGPVHPEVANSLGRLALLYTNQKKYEEAEPLYLRALAIREEILGPEHPDVARSLSRLMVLASEQGNYEQAESFLERALAIYDKIPELQHPQVAISFNDFAKFYSDRGKYEQAISLFQRSITIQEKSLGPENPKIVPTLENYAHLLRKTGRKTEAEALETRAQIIRSKRE